MTATRKPKLLPCPFPECDKPPKVWSAEPGSRTMVGCWNNDSHDLTCESDLEHEAIARWNSLPRARKVKK